MEAVLGGIGCDAIAVASGVDALRHLLSNDVALILLDVKMPGMDGYETARLIRARERTRGTPIIFVTAYSRDEAELLDGYALGAVDFLSKPIVPAILRAKVSVFVQLHERGFQLAQQAKRLADAERDALRGQLEADRREWEAQALRAQMEQERATAEELTLKAAELARTVATLERTEVELLQSNQRLSSADQRKDEFLAILGHELRNPLAPMVNALELLRGRVGDDGVGSEAHAAMERQVDHLCRLVDDLLDMSRIDSGKIELRRETVGLGDVILHAEQMTRPLFTSREQHLVVALPDPPISLTADPTRLVQIVANLLTNASRYSGRGSTTWITGAAEDGDAVVRVRDEGRGIAPEFVHHVFDTFAQAKSGGVGLGVGLTIAKRLIERHGGSITCRSEGLGRGSEFAIRLPLQKAAGTGPQPPVVRVPTAPEPAGEPPLRIVLVEDSEDIRETTAALLALHGHTVATATDGPSGVELILQSRPDVALVDIGLPGFDGHEVAARVRAALGTGVVRLVAMTGFGQDADRQRARDAGFDDHLTKPAKAAQLRGALRGST
jgi:signal transduction histidine kinase